MKLDLKTIEAITTGAESVEYKNGGFAFHRFTDAEAASADNYNVEVAAGVALRFKTDAAGLVLKISTEDISNGCRSYFAADVFENGKAVGSIQNISDSDCTGNYAEKSYPFGEFTGEFKLSKGEKEIKIYLPHTMKTEITEIDAVDATYVVPVKSGKILLAYGDSITQGYDSLHPSGTYVMRLAEMLGAEAYSKALGGDVFCPELASAAGDLKPDYIIAAYGTNDWKRCYTQDTVCKNASEFLSAVTHRFENTPVFVISPIWRKDNVYEDTSFDFFKIKDVISRACDKFETVKFIDGTDFMPRSEALFGDLRLHPTAEGFKYYADALYKEISNILNLMVDANENK